MSDIFLTLNAKVANKDIRREKRNGREVIIVPAATLPDNVVMNSIKYPPDFIESVYNSLNGTPAPVGHPQFNGVYVNAANQEAQNAFGVGAWNDNVRRHGGRVYYDKVIDVAVANSSEKGKALLAAIERKEPIHTSTGLAMNTRDESGPGYTKVAVKGTIDHDAFLLDEPGAATPEQGVGVFVNSQGEKLTVVNSEMPEMLENVATSAAFDMVDIEDRLNRVTRVQKFKERFVKMFSDMLDFEAPEKPETVANSGEAEMSSITPEQLAAALKEQAETLTANTKQFVEEAVKAATDPLREELNAVNADAKAARAAEHAKAVETVVNAKLLDEAEAKELPLNALNALIKTTKSAAPLAPGHMNSRADGAENYDTLPE